ncbi:hypothetical protein H5410_025410 [Solanum commersonii]|uniref:Uncharacterized protein n=1 Tax=Solanum commersonii TaxID=4109 RepID=A0A9J5YYF9_SOLCO|nr:hypothetical protein H5410_025410 [Solanum commersonii]
MDWLLVSKLQLEECHMITEAGFFGIVLNCGLNQLEDQHVSFNYKVTDKSVELHGESLESLIDYNFGQCCTAPFADHLTVQLPYGVRQKLTLLARVGGQDLHCMNIQHCPGISSSTVDMLVEQH